MNEDKVIEGSKGVKGGKDSNFGKEVKGGQDIKKVKVDIDEGYKYYQVLI